MGNANTKPKRSGDDTASTVVTTATKDIKPDVDDAAADDVARKRRPRASPSKSSSQPQPLDSTAITPRRKNNNNNKHRSPASAVLQTRDDENSTQIREEQVLVNMAMSDLMAYLQVVANNSSQLPLTKRDDPDFGRSVHELSSEDYARKSAAFVPADVRFIGGVFTRYGPVWDLPSSEVSSCSLLLANWICTRFRSHAFTHHILPHSRKRRNTTLATAHKNPADLTEEPARIPS
jgi:hypothetical protein